MKNRNLNHKDNWATPDYFYDPLNAEFNFDFDPCPFNAEAIKPENDGLLIDWGERNYVNPPYSLKLKTEFVKRAVYFAGMGRLSVVLLPVSTSTKLFHEVILPNKKEIRFIRRRIKFKGWNSEGVWVENSCGMHDSMLVIF